MLFRSQEFDGKLAAKKALRDRLLLADEPGKPIVAFIGRLDGQKGVPLVPKPKMQNIKVFVGITTSGSPWWWIRLIRDPGRSLWTRGLRPMFSPRCKVVWKQLYNMNHTTPADRAGYLARVESALKKLPVQA